MSVQSEITRITNARNTLRTKGVSLGIAVTTDDITAVATKFNAIADRGTPNAEVKEGETYTINPGYYHGGTVQGVAGGGSYNLQAKSVTPTKSAQSVTADAGYYGLSTVSVGAIPEAYQDVTNVTATSSDVLTGKVFVDSKGNELTGIMQNRGAVTSSLDCGESYTIPLGYHNGSGKITANSLASQTTVTSGSGATSAMILDGKEAWVEGVKVTGTIESKTGSDITLNCGATSTYEAGYYPSEWTVTANTLAAQTTVTSGTGATSAMILNGKEAWVEGVKITGNIPTKTGTSTSLNCGGSSSYQAGYYPNGWTVTANSLASQTGVDTGKTAATASQIVTGYQAWVNGAKISGSMADNGAVTATLTGLGTVAGDTSYTIPAGYHEGTGTVSITNDIETALSAI